jgi:hypothetical protein
LLVWILEQWLIGWAGLFHCFEDVFLQCHPSSVIFLRIRSVRTLNLIVSSKERDREGERETEREREREREGGRERERHQALASMPAAFNEQRGGGLWGTAGAGWLLGGGGAAWGQTRGSGLEREGSGCLRIELHIHILYNTSYHIWYR